MKRITGLLLFITALALSPRLYAQDKMQTMVNRLKTFGSKLPQEQVFLHLDNSSYYLGDTIFFKAYVRRSDNGRPTDLSGILYCELLNHDGFLIERQMIPLETGEGHGNFAIVDTALYAGYYELRAYTRWQLNWGVTEQPHSKWAENFFFNKSMAKDYYRDYEKLYSRVFPVYNKPLTPGDFTPEMTMRPLASYYKNPGDEPETTLQFFPEGGNLVAGVKQRVAWEVRNEIGKALDGTLSIEMPDGSTITSEVSNRGRGVFEITAPEGMALTAHFSPSAKGENPTGTLPAKAKLPEAVRDGIALRVSTDTTGIYISYNTSGMASQDTLGITIMRNGVLQHFSTLDGNPLRVPCSVAGVYQITLFNNQGKVYADRLCFYLPSGLKATNIHFSGLKDGNYTAFEPISMEINGQPGASISLAVRDAAKSEYVYDTGNMLTEALLSSQIRGFVPQPEWFFQKDNTERRLALDLLLMVQGWRRHVWREMAVPGEFEIVHMPESRYPHWTGQIHNYSAEQVLSVIEQKMHVMADKTNGNTNNQAGENTEEEESGSTEQKKERPDHTNKTADRFNKTENTLEYPVALHAEFSQPGTEGVDGDMRSQGIFNLNFPRYYGEFFFFLGASDTTKWKKGQPPVWTQNGRSKHNEVEFPEYYVKLDPIYPRFPKPYDYYQSHIAPMPTNYPLYNKMDEDVRMLSEVTIGASSNGRRRFGRLRPAFIIDAYEAFNAACDAGFTPGYFMGTKRFGIDVARTYVGDMKTERAYDISYRFDGEIYSEGTEMRRRKEATDLPTSMPRWQSNMSDTKLDKYNYMWNLSDVVVYTDYSPRNDQPGRYKGNEVPKVTINLQLLKDDEVRSYQKNRRWKMKGFSVPDKFYSPDYSKQPLPKADHRRTLYWNPNVKLDLNGKATISLYNNSSPSILQISAEGWAPDGTPQSGRVN